MTIFIKALIYYGGEFFRLAIQVVFLLRGFFFFFLTARGGKYISPTNCVIVLQAHFPDDFCCTVGLCFCLLLFFAFDVTS